MTWRWVAANVVYAIHDRQLAEHGGGDGIRDRGIIELALGRPQNLLSYAEPDGAALAAAYAFGIARNHGFVDGNKRTAWIVARLFLADNGYTLKFAPRDAIQQMEGLAAGSVTEDEMPRWFRDRIVGKQVSI